MNSLFNMDFSEDVVSKLKGFIKSNPDLYTQLTGHKMPGRPKGVPNKEILTPGKVIEVEENSQPEPISIEQAKKILKQNKEPRQMSEETRSKMLENLAKGRETAKRKREELKKQQEEQKKQEPVVVKKKYVITPKTPKEKEEKPTQKPTNSKEDDLMAQIKETQKYIEELEGLLMEPKPKMPEKSTQKKQPFSVLRSPYYL